MECVYIVSLKNIYRTLPSSLPIQCVCRCGSVFLAHQNLVSTFGVRAGELVRCICLSVSQRRWALKVLGETDKLSLSSH